MNKHYIVRTFSVNEYTNLYRNGFAEWKYNMPEEDLKIKFSGRILNYRIYFSYEAYLIFKLKFNV